MDLTLADPWSRDTPPLLTRSMSHVATASLVMPDGEEFALDLTAGRVRWDETRSPRVSASLTCKVPSDQALLDRLDPRTGARLLISAGYRRPDGLEDIQPLCDLGLRSRRVSRPDDEMNLEALSDEALLIDSGPSASGSVTDTTTLNAIASVIRTVFPGMAFIYTGAPAGPAVTAVLYQDRWDVVADLADRIEIQVFDGGLRQWYLLPTPVLSPSATALELAVGSNGTIIGSDAGLDRDEGWGNYVWLRYEWRDSGGTDQVVNATRRVTSGAYAAVTGNTRILRFDRNVATTQAEANAAAAALVARTVTRGRSFSVNAISAYWLRPGHTVDVRLPLGDTESHLVTAVDFDLVAGSMDVTTRLPDNTGTIGA